MTNPETQNDPETWNVAGIIQQKRGTKEMEKAYLRKPYDTMQIYNSALAMCEYFLKCDELAQIPNEKGKIKNKYRKANASLILGEKNNLINGGIEYYNKMLEAERAENMDKAKEIGMTNTHFSNTHGLWEADNYSTPYDLYLMCRYAYEKHPELIEISNTQEYVLPANTYNPDPYTITNVNSMIRNIDDNPYYYEYASNIDFDEILICLEKIINVIVLETV